MTTKSHVPAPAILIRWIATATVLVLVGLGLFVLLSVLMYFRHLVTQPKPATTREHRRSAARLLIPADLTRESFERRSTST